MRKTRRTPLILFAYLLLSFVVSSPALAMDYLKLVSAKGTSVLFMSGKIEVGELTRFEDNFSRLQPIQAIWVSSGGGNVAEAINIGKALRAAEMRVRVPSVERLRGSFERSFSADHLRVYGRRYLREQPRCASACGMILAGGKVRLVDVARTVGVHSLSTSQNLGGQGRAISKGAIVGAQWAIFMQDMDITEGYVQKALSTGPACMYYLSSSEMDRWNVVNLKSRLPPDQNARGVQEPQGIVDCWN